MGHRPPRASTPPGPRTNEEHWISWARAAYIEGRTTVDEFEAAVWDALNGRCIRFDGTPAFQTEEVQR